jgi:predicted Rossmann-fold nucleotide-binding protein
MCGYRVALISSEASQPSCCSDVTAAAVCDSSEGERRATMIAERRKLGKRLPHEQHVVYGGGGLYLEVKGLR